jgi:predicted PurR-regulated permease PerM
MPSHTLSKPISDRSEPPPLKRRRCRSIRVQLATRAAFAILLVLLALWVGSDFLTALAWAAVIAITTWPVYIRFATLISDHRSPVSASLLFTLLTGLVLHFCRASP